MYEPIPKGNEIILFDEDEAMIAKLGNKILKPPGCIVAVRTNGIMAHAKLRITG
ncbi:MAG: hypothetical protein J7K40_05835 [candidate division Zixibacteria bacterium]|nr:hypothetical protein [candidate division Zixibacteria bacterium]